MNGMRESWTDAQLSDLRRLFPRFKTEDVAFMIGKSVSAAAQKAKVLGLRKSAEYLASAASGRLRAGDGRGGSTRFNKGITPWNKGLSFVAGGRSAETRFSAGQAPHNTQPVGAYRLDKDGTLQRKISSDRGNNSKRWRGVHELVWIEANGPLPPKHIVVFRPGMRTSVLEGITADKVECISLAENMRRNTRHNLPPELNEVVQLRAVLTRQINKRRKQHGA